MKINYQNNNINFHSIERAKVVIKKRAKRRYIPQAATISELIVGDKKDMATINKLVNSWQKNEIISEALYANDILTNFNTLSLLSDDFAQDTKLNTNYRFFVLEENNNQKEEYENILGIMQFDEPICKEPCCARNKIHWLQVNPVYKFQKKKQIRQYKGIGKNLVEFVKNLSQRTIEVYSATNAIDFYKKLGFRQPFTTSDIFLTFSHKQAE